MTISIIAAVSIVAINLAIYGYIAKRDRELFEAQMSYNG